MEEIFQLIKAFNRLEENISNLTSKIDILLKYRLRKVTMNEKEASKFLGISERTLITLRSQGKIPVLRINRRVIYRTKDLYRYLEENVEKGNFKIAA